MALYTFCSAWEPAPRPLTGGMLLAIGDVHGHLEHLDAILDRLRSEVYRARSHSLACELVMLGDYVDRGPDSLGTLRRLITLERSLGVPVHVLCGNHDQYLIDFVLALQPEPQALEVWIENGGATTLAELGIRRAELLNRDPADLAARARAKLGPEVLCLLRRLQLSRPVGSYVCAHAGINPAQPLSENCRRELLWLREPFLTGKDWRHDVTAIHGHTIRGPEVLPYRIAVDSGTYRIGVLSALQIENERLRFVCVTSEPKLKAFKRLPGLDQKRRFSSLEALVSMPELQLAVGA
jgi:serine/threonine protein phosphatase 1